MFRHMVGNKLSGVSVLKLKYIQIAEMSSKSLAEILCNAWDHIRKYINRSLI